MRCPTLSELPPPPPGKTGWPWTEESPQLPDTMPNGRPWPKISIVTPNYNYGKFLEETIRSVLLQGYPNLEYIIIDGGSTDNSVEIIKKYEPWLAYWVSEPDKGQSNAINKGFSKATGDIYAWLNSDDKYLVYTLRTIAEWAQANPDSGAFAGGAQRINEKDQVVFERYPTGLSFEEILNWNHHYLPQASCFFRSTIWIKCGPLDETLHFQMDYDLWLKIAKVSKFTKIPKILSRDLLHKEAKTVSHKFEIDRMIERWIVLMRHNPNKAKTEIYKTLAWQLKAKSLLGKINSIKPTKTIKLITRITSRLRQNEIKKNTNSRDRF